MATTCTLPLWIPRAQPNESFDGLVDLPVLHLEQATVARANAAMDEIALEAALDQQEQAQLDAILTGSVSPRVTPTQDAPTLLPPLPSLSTITQASAMSRRPAITTQMNALWMRDPTATMSSTPKKNSNESHIDLAVAHKFFIVFWDKVCILFVLIIELMPTDPFSGW
jgi:hypothetical protein